MKQFFFTLTLIFIASSSFADGMCIDGESAYYNVDKNGVALKGYDIISYHDLDTPQPGLKEFEAELCGVIYRFSSKAHLEKFETHPFRYKLELGGWNPFSLAFQAFTDIDPTIFAFHDERLVFFINKTTRDRFLETPHIRDRAMKFWISTLNPKVN